MASDVLELLRHERRRSIACAAVDQPLTIREIAGRLNTVDGAIRSVVKRLKDAGLLVPGERPARGGSTATTYIVAPSYADRVRELCEAEERLALVDGDELLLIPAANLASAARFLADERPQVIAWAVRTKDPQLSLMIGLRRDSEPQDRDGVLMRLIDAGVDARRLYIGEPFAPAELFSYAATLGGMTGSGRTLPAPSVSPAGSRSRDAASRACRSGR